MRPKSWYTSMRKESWWLLGALVLLLASIWPMRMLKKLPVHHTALQQQWMQVQTMAQEAARLKAQPINEIDLGADALAQSVKENLGDKASVTRNGDIAVVTLNGLPHAELGRVLNLLRHQAGAQVDQLQLKVQAGAVSGRVELMLPEAL